MNNYYLKLATASILILFYSNSGLAQAKNALSKEEQLKYIKAESKIRCSCYKEEISNFRKEKKAADKSDREKSKTSSFPIITVFGSSNIDSCYILKRKQDLWDYVNGLDSLSRIQFEKNVVRKIKSDCSEKVNEMKKMGYRIKYPRPDRGDM